MNNPFISIIMAAYNAERTIGAAIESVLSQTYSHYELIVIDDHSTDRTVQVVQSFHDDRIVLLSHARNMGVAHSRHDGVEHARAEWISILDSDDLWRSDKLEREVRHQEATGGDLIFTGSLFIYDDGRLVNWVQHAPKQIVYRTLLRHNAIPNSSTLIRKELFQRYEVISDHVHEDYVCWLRLLRDGYTAFGIDEPMITYRLTTNARTGNKWKSMRMNWRTYRYVGLSIPASLYYMVWYISHGLRKYANF